MKVGLAYRGRLRGEHGVTGQEIDLTHQALTAWRESQHTVDGGHTDVTSETLVNAGTTSFGGRWLMPDSAVLTPPYTITADQDNYDPRGLDDAIWLRLSTDASRTLTGIIPLSASETRHLILTNVGNFDIVLSHNDTASRATARFANPMAGDVTIGSAGSVWMLYDTSSGNWRIISFSGSVAGVITSSGSGGAPDNASYVTLGTNGDLTSERVLTAGPGITITDAGAGSTVTVKVAYAQTLVVAKSGGDFSTIQGAIDSISDNSASKRYLIQIMPGNYAEQVTMKAYVDLRGAGKHATQIEFGSTGGAVILSDSCQIEDLLIELTATEGHWAIVGDNVSRWHIRNVDILASNNTKRGAGIKVTGSSWATGFIEHCVINTHTQTNHGIRLESDGSDLADVTLNDVFVDSLSATTGGAVLLNDILDIQLRDVFSRTAAAAYGVRVTGTSDVTLQNCWLESGTESLEVAGGTVQVNNSVLDTWTNTSGTLRGIWQNPDTGLQRLRDASAKLYIDATGSTDAALELQDADTQKGLLWWDQSLGNLVLQNVVASEPIVLQTNAGDVNVYNGSSDVARILSSGTVELLEQGSSPSTPSSGYGRLYHKTDGLLYYKNDGGTETVIPMVQFVRKASDESLNSTTTLQADDALLFAVGASETWEFEFNVHYLGNSTGDFRCGLKFPTSPTQIHYGIIGPDVAASGTPVVGDAKFAGGFTADAVAGLALGADTGQSVALLKGFIRNGSNTGNVVLWWAQGTSDGTNTTVKAGSFVTARRLA